MAIQGKPSELKLGKCFLVTVPMLIRLDSVSEANGNATLVLAPLDGGKAYVDPIPEGTKLLTKAG